MSLFPENVNFLSTVRHIKGGRSTGSFVNFNLALHVNDKTDSVLENRSILKDYYELPSEPVWINQTHSSICVDALSNTLRIDCLRDRHRPQIFISWATDRQAF